MFLFRKNRKDGEEETPKCERKFRSAHKRWQSDWSWAEPRTRGTQRRINVLNKQVNPFLEQEARGFAILQRRHRLMQLLGDEEDPAVTEKRPPGYITQTQRENFQKAVQDLTVDYWKNAAGLRKMQESWQSEYELEKLQLLRAHKDRHGRPYAWVWDQEKCADLGGCCGQTCGCCRKPLLTYLRPSEDQEEVHGVYGHCTEECACCIRSGRRRPPHPRLPPAPDEEFEYVWIVPVLFLAWFVCKAVGRVLDKVADQVGEEIGTRLRPLVRDWQPPVFKWTRLWDGVLSILRWLGCACSRPAPGDEENQTAGSGNGGRGEPTPPGQTTSTPGASQTSQPDNFDPRSLADEPARH
ncbi:hypothetical protein IFM46972_09382 [Aspergillus udagawae]|uniref:Uncharacterized protein n=1 Tax=Aspergillus udagawae TaxID=91492 RepID=A0A8H3S6A9_9EURO|nr:hypothetical protein IFM46972_09382 [Aspergillus udagawae]